MIMSKDPFENYSLKKERKRKKTVVAGLATFALLGAVGYSAIRSQDVDPKSDLVFKDFTFPQDKFIEDSIITSSNENRRKVEELKKLLFLQKHAPEAKLVEEANNKLKRKNEEADLIVQALIEEQKKGQELKLAIQELQKTLEKEMAAKELYYQSAENELRQSIAELLKEKENLTLALNNALIEQDERVKQLEREKQELQDSFALKMESVNTTQQVWKDYSFNLAKDLDELQEAILVKEQTKGDKDQEIFTLKQQISALENQLDLRKQSIENFKNYLNKLSLVHAALGDTLAIERLLQTYRQEESAIAYESEAKQLFHKIQEVNEELDTVYAKLYNEELDKDSALVELDYAKEKSAQLESERKNIRKIALQALNDAGHKTCSLEEALLVQEVKLALANEYFAKERDSLLEETASSKKKIEELIAESYALKDSLEKGRESFSDSLMEKEALAVELDRYKTLLEDSKLDLIVRSEAEKSLMDQLELAKLEQAKLVDLLNQSEEALAKAYEEQNLLKASLSELDSSQVNLLSLIADNQNAALREQEQLIREKDELILQLNAQAALLKEKENSLEALREDEGKLQAELASALALTEGLPALKNENDQLRQRLSDTQEELAFRSEQERNLQTEFALLEKEGVQSIALFEKSQELARAEVESLKQNRDELVELLNQREESLANFAEREEKLKADLAKALALKDELLGIKTERDGLAKLLDEKEKDLKQFSKNELFLNEQLINAFAAIDELELMRDENERLSGLLRDVQDNLATRKEVERHLKEEIALLESEREEWNIAKIKNEESEKTLLVELEGRLALAEEAKLREITLQNALEAYKLHLATLEKQNFELNEELAKVKLDQSHLDEEALLNQAAFLAQSEALLQELQAFKNEKAELEKENAIAKNSLDELQEEIKSRETSLQNALEAYKAHLAELTQQNKQLESELAKAEELKTREATLQNALDAYKEHLAELEAQNLQLGKELSKAKDVRKSVEEELIAQNSATFVEAELLLRELQAFKDENLELEKENALAKSSLIELSEREQSARNYADRLEALVAEKEEAFSKLKTEESGHKESLLKESEALKLAFEEEKNLHEQIELALRRKELEHAEALGALEFLKQDLLEKERLYSSNLDEQLHSKKELEESIGHLQGYLKLQTVKAETLQQAFEQERRKSEESALEIARLENKMQEKYDALTLLEQREKLNEEQFIAERAALAELLERESERVRNLSEELALAHLNEEKAKHSVEELTRLLNEKELALLDEIDSHHTVQENLNRKIAELTNLLQIERSRASAASKEEGET